MFYLLVSLFREDQILGVIVFQAIDVFTDLLSDFCPTDGVHETFKSFRLFIIRLIDSNRYVDLI